MNRLEFLEKENAVLSIHKSELIEKVWSLERELYVVRRVSDSSTMKFSRKIDRLRKALEEIENSSAGDFDSVRQIAQQALEGDNNDTT